MPLRNVRVLWRRSISELAHLLYEGGYAPYSTVLQAEQQLFPEELTLATTRAQLLASLVSIYRTMGGGWVDEAAKLTAAPGAASNRTTKADTAG